ncbi:SusC/RagA family TonB-linked outer membrane protein [Mangrovibacterium diazotrophicum]|uniref:TonB-linked SusC/RagA family outer membrane protein n=1 Tax=Mangrovibacterium diazotrophicum TaxID=1261403 RepID=A0A419W9R0_9BACT|nr:SusC/RagA family TonB-linked outer membrane protein [Mangrovibacterium diazotrophicum]RKD92208.1 TonB-linked SusC/RagA family outer membrane protein [Mangrovibacterium diazotrophicum]
MKKTFLLIFLLAFLINAFAQGKMVSGVVTSASDGTTLPGVNISVKGTTKGTVSDIDGKYSLEVAEGDVLLFSFIGMKTQEVKVGASAVLDVAMAADALGLDEVVVTGAGALTKKKQLGNAISTIPAIDIQESGAISVGSALSGKLAGAQVMQNSGNPSGGISVRLRGASTVLGSSDPLYIIDGVVVNNESRELINLGGYTQNRLVDIEPQDIERVEVIKGAAAAAIYGSRASNGVVQIWTKRGSSERLDINVNSQLSVSEVRKTLPYNDVNLIWDGDGTTSTNADGTPVKRYNYQDLIFHTAVGTKNYVSLSRAKGDTKYFFSASHFDNEGIVNGTNFKRTTARLRIDDKLTSWMDMSVGTSISYNTSQNQFNNEDFNYGLLTSLLFADNSVDMRPTDGVYPSFGWITNIQEAIDLVDAQQINKRAITDFKLALHPFKGFSMDYTFGYDYSNSLGKLYVPVGFNTTPQGVSQKESLDEMKLNNDLNARYMFNINEDIVSTTAAGYSLQYEKYQILSLSAENLIPAVESSNAGTVTGRNDYMAEKSIRGYYLQQTFGYKDKLFLTGAIRVDESSVFGDDERRQTYPKVSGSYVVSDNDFWKESSFGNIVNTFKLRSSWGQAGNMTAIEAYDRYTNYSTVSIDGTTGLIKPSTLGNKDVKPERQTEFEVGTDLEFLSGRLGLEMTYYKQDIEDLLLERTLSPSTGAEYRVENVGTMTNKGFELLLKAAVIQKKDLNWDLTATFSTNKNKVDGIEGDIITYAWGESAAKNGYPLGVFYGYYYARNDDGSLLLTADGLPQREKGHYENNEPVSERDANGQPTGENLKKVIGDPNPDFIASLINEVRYKKWSFRVQFDAVQGYDVISWDKRILNRYAGGDGYAKELRGDRPKGWGVAEYSIYDSFIEDGSFVKLRELSLGYRIKPAVDWCESIKLSLTGRNLFSFDNYYGMDPEVNREGQSNVVRGNDMANVPIPRTIIFGVNVNF